MELYFVNSLLEYFCIMLFYLTFSGRRVQKINLIVYVILSLISGLVFYYVNPHWLFKLLLQFLIPFAALFPYKINDLILCIASVSIMIFIEFAAFSLYPASLLHTHLGDSVACLTAITTASVLFFISQRQSLHHEWSAIFLKHKFITIITFLFLSVFGLQYVSRLTVLWPFLPGLVVLLGFICAFAAFLFYLRHQRSEDRKQNQLLQQKIGDSELYIRELRRQNHDYRHHLNYIESMTHTTSDPSELKQQISDYIHEIYTDRNVESAILNTGDPLLRALLYNCYSQCRSGHIDFRFSSTDMLPSFPLKEYEYVEMLENLTANAVEAQLDLPEEDRKITISLRHADGNNEFSISNAIMQNADLDQMFLLGETNKGHSHQGIGLYSVSQLAARNGITFYGSTEENSITFTLSYQEDDDRV